MAGEPRTLRPHQEYLLRSIVERPRCAVWAGMGMGKTSVALTLLDLLYGVLGERAPTLVLAPKRVVTDVWCVEPGEWGFSSLKVTAVVGSAANRQRALASDANVFACNYDNVAWLVRHYGRRWPFRTVIADESTKLKGFRLQGGGIRARALASVAHQRVDRWINLTGTPSPNGLIDLWGQTWFLDAGERLGSSFTAFRNRWFRSIERRDKDGNRRGLITVPTEAAEVEIPRRLADITVAVRPQDWFSLDAPIVNRVRVTLPRAAREHYRQLEREYFTQVREHSVEALTSASRSSKCLQLASGAMYTTDPDTGEPTGSWVDVHDAKIEALASIIEEAAGTPVVVVYKWRPDLAKLRKAFPQGVELRDTADTNRKWNAGEIPVLFVQPQSAGHGINLQYGGNILVFYSYDWNLEDHDQVIERIGPMRQRQAGLDRPVFIHYLIARDTLDASVITRLVEKADVQDTLREAMAKREHGEEL